MILLDGAGDRSCSELNHRTPLQAARTPALDQIAEKGANGLYHAALLGQALPSENAHFAMFGYDSDVFPGRGALEALGAGIALNAGEVALLAHFVSVKRSPDGTLTLMEGKPQASDDEIQSLIGAVDDYTTGGIRLRLFHTHGFRGILTLAGNVAPFVTDSDPITAGCALTAVTPWRKFADDPPTRKTSQAVGSYLEWVHHTLTRHPVNSARRKAGRPLLNALVTQRAGRLRKATPFAELNGMRGLSISSGIVYHGLCSYLGMDVRRVTDTADPGNDLCRRIQMALASLSEYDFIHVHTKMPDEAAHRKDPLYKARVLEELDHGIGAVLARLTSEPETIIVVAADHSTPSAGPLIHSGEAVPLVFCGPGVRRDRIRRYDEVSAAGGALGFVRGKELMYLIINHLDRAKLHGLMDTPVDQVYWPGRSEPFTLENGKKATDGERSLPFVCPEMKNPRQLYETGVIHGRFQVLHNDHLKYLLAGKALCRRLVVGITNPDPQLIKKETQDPKRSRPLANPLTYFERHIMVETALLDAGLKPRDFMIVPFPINFPERYRYYVPMDAVFFLTIFDEWGKRKQQYFKSLGLTTHLLWEVPPDKKGISGSDIRERIATNQAWEHLVPACVPVLIERWNIRDRLEELQKK